MSGFPDVVQPPPQHILTLCVPAFPSHLAKQDRAPLGSKGWQAGLCHCLSTSAPSCSPAVEEPAHRSQDHRTLHSSGSPLFLPQMSLPLPISLQSPPLSPPVSPRWRQATGLDASLPPDVCLEAEPSEGRAVTLQVLPPS